MGAQETVALGIGLYFLCLFKAPCHWFISPNRVSTFLRENSNGIKVRDRFLGQCFPLGHHLPHLRLRQEGQEGPPEERQRGQTLPDPPDADKDEVHNA